MNLLKLALLSVTAREYQMLINDKTNANLSAKLSAYSSLDTSKMLHHMSDKNIEMVTILEDHYPEALRELHDPPYILFYIGNYSIIHHPMLGIVGSRKSTGYTKTALSMLLSELSGITIVSGLAYGADESAHVTALEEGLPTIGVLGFGHGVHYPKSTLKLRERLECEGLVISEYPPYSPVEKWKFVARNRIIAGLSTAVLVTEAEEKSGSLITLEMALDDNKAVLCLPGNITSKLSRGTNKMIAEGAKPVLSGLDIIEEF